MGKGANSNDPKVDYEREKIFNWKEIKSNKYLIVIDNKVFNIENFSKKHPGGEQIIMNHATQDATVFYRSF